MGQQSYLNLRQGAEKWEVLRDSVARFGPTAILRPPCILTTVRVATERAHT